MTALFSFLNLLCRIIHYCLDQHDIGKNMQTDNKN